MCSTWHSHHNLPKKFRRHDWQYSLLTLKENHHVLHVTNPPEFTVSKQPSVLAGGSQTALLELVSYLPTKEEKAKQICRIVSQR